ncbi:hypothetical protein [Candidatus Oscillochloris fontis]|uniref:hypothetical protein n=1 Tax=Candidatus Oscillochloris fontis TaxID=2496868 RepID=UPI00101D50E2|nr:hypothetical protein [Candidatus Oscillochloris fontis]
MTLRLDLLRSLTTSTPPEAWRMLIAQVLAIMSPPLTLADAPSEVTRRDRTVAALDLLLAGSGWDLWHVFDPAVERTASHLIRWWHEPYQAKALLILDGLSLRELPWLIQGAQHHGFTIHATTACAAELPGETNAFAQALGYTSRSQLQNNGGSHNDQLPGARTESIDLPWRDGAALVDATPNWVFWHHWPDVQLHRVAGAGQGLESLTREVAAQLTSADFWDFVARLATGRRLVITSDHGYAATGLFSDATGEAAALLKRTFRSGRSAAGALDPGPFAPPVALQLDTPHGSYTLALGRWKWPSPGGYPTLAHGGLSLLEVLAPFVVLTK